MKYRYLCKFLLNCGTKTKNDNTSNVQNRMLSLYHSVLQHNTKPGLSNNLGTVDYDFLSNAYLINIMSIKFRKFHL